jgi:hypothetical protein
MARELQNPAGLHPAPGFSHVAVAQGTRVVHFAGPAVPGCLIEIECTAVTD